MLDRGERGTHESSMAKVICSEAIWRVVDRSMQILGGLGITDDTIVARLFRDIRPFRIYDGPSEAETFWIEFLRSLARRGLRGIKLVISDAHEGLKAAVAKVLHASWQRCRVHFMRNVLAYAGRQGRRVVAAFIGTAFVQDDADSAPTQWTPGRHSSATRRRN